MIMPMTLQICGLKALLILGLVLLVPSSLQAQESAESVLAKYVDAMGGMEKLKGVRSARCTADVWVNGLETTITRLEKWPSSSRLEVQWPNGKSTISSTSPVRTEGQPDYLSLPIFGDLIAYAMNTKSGSKVAYLGSLDEERVAAIVIALYKVDGSSQSYYLDPLTFLPFKIISQKPKSESLETIYLGGWYREGGIAFNRRSAYYTNGKMFESHRNEQCVLNPAIDDSVFAKEAK